MFFSEVYIDPDKGIPYDILMTKVDTKYGMYGLNNFYKMQVKLSITIVIILTTATINMIISNNNI